MKEKERKALITLLEDPDVEVYNELEHTLLNRGINFVSELELVWENSLSELLHKRVEGIIETIQFTSILQHVEYWITNESADLLKGAFLLAKYQYPDLKFKDIEQAVNLITEDVEAQINFKTTALEKTKIINHLIFDIYKFSGSVTGIYAPQNCFINNVVDSKRGNTISLAILYASIAQKLDIPIYGVNLPQNFILAFLNKPFREEKENEVLFYINPFNSGAVLGRKEIDFFLNQQKIKVEDTFYTPCTNIITVKRIIQHLIAIYEKTKTPEKAKPLQKIISIFQKYEK